MGKPLTTLELRKIQELYDNGLNYQQISRILGRSVAMIARWCHLTGRPTREAPIKPHKLYYVYLRGTDELLAFGTSRECVERLEITLASFYSAVSRANKGTKYQIFVERLYDEN